MSKKFPMFTGVNIAGGEWLWNATVTPKEGVNYQFVTEKDCDYLISKKFNFGRLLFSWELVQPTLNEDFSTTYTSVLKARVDYLTSKGMYVMIEPHGGTSSSFARYKGNVVGSTAVPNSAFADLWKRFALLFKDNPRVVFGLSNEPNNMSTAQWFSAAQAAIAAVRETGAQNYIMVPGNGWTQPASWNDTWYDTASTKMSNATGWSSLKDPLSNLIVSVHTYFDKEGGGEGNDIVSQNIIVQRLQPVVDWARKTGVKVHLSEFGCSSTVATAQAAVTATCEYVKANSDVLVGWSWWTYGNPAWWGSYAFTLAPKSNYTIDDVKISWLVPYLMPMQNPADFVDPPPPSVVENIVLTTSKVKAPGDQGKNFTKVIGPGKAVPEGTYTLKTAVRTMYSDQTGFSTNVVMQNDHLNVDFSWDEMTIDLRGHTIGTSWNVTIVGVDSAGFTVVKPTVSTKTILAQGKNSFGFFLQRNPVVPNNDYQILVKSIKW